MANNDKKAGGEEAGFYRHRINLVEDDELRRWARLLAVTPEVLKDAAKRVGAWTDDLQLELNAGRLR